MFFVSQVKVLTIDLLLDIVYKFAVCGVSQCSLVNYVCRELLSEFKILDTLHLKGAGNGYQSDQGSTNIDH